MTRVLARPRSRIVICALQTYSTIGGLQNFNRRVLQNLAQRAVEDGNAPALAILKGDHNAGPTQIDGLESIAPKSFFGFLAQSFWRSVVDAKALLICHVNLLPIAVAVRLFRPRLPIILFVHGYEVWNKEGRREKRRYENWFIKAVTRIVSVSRYTAEVMGAEFNVAPDKFRILPNAVDRADPPACAAAQRSDTILTVTRLGAAEREKNVDVMISAVASLRRKLPSVRYEIVGEGALRPELEALARDLGVDDIIAFRGRIDKSALDEAYGRASVFAMPSDKEGFGIVYLEAWQHGLPVICSVHGAASEIVSDGVEGFVVNPVDVPQLTERLYKLLTQPEMAKSMGERGRRKVQQKYLNANFRFHLDRILDELSTDARRGEVASQTRSQSNL
jgi:phosphatidyl-myo-inositol dimannoside synthase